MSSRMRTAKASILAAAFLLAVGPLMVAAYLDYQDKDQV